MRIALLLVAAGCSTPIAGEARVARWEIDGSGSYAVALCPDCDAPVAHDGSRCGDCGAAYRVEPKVVEWPDCKGTRRWKPACEACEDTGRCPICEGSGAFEGTPCPECEWQKACGACEPAAADSCDNCLGQGVVELR